MRSECATVDMGRTLVNAWLLCVCTADSSVVVSSSESDSASNSNIGVIEDCCPCRFWSRCPCAVAVEFTGCARAMLMVSRGKLTK